MTEQINPVFFFTNYDFNGKHKHTINNMINVEPASTAPINDARVIIQDELMSLPFRIGFDTYMQQRGIIFLSAFGRNPPYCAIWY